ncbi:MAG: hypothetical protein ACE5F1_03775 [Planctomycetota bacterium]
MEEDLKSLGRKLVRFLNTFIALGVSVYFLLDRSLTDAALRGKLPTKNFLALCGAGLLLINVLGLLYFRRSKKRDYEGPLLSYTGDGVIKVSRGAIEAGLRAVGEALDEVTRLRVKVLTPARKRVVIRALYLAPEGVQILELSGRLRKALQEQFQLMVQMEREGRLEIEIIFEGFYGKPLSKPDAETQPEEEASTEETRPPPPPFTGPRYPVDLGEETV